jgi:hypothetical protein
MAIGSLASGMTRSCPDRAYDTGVAGHVSVVEGQMAERQWIQHARDLLRELTGHEDADESTSTGQATCPSAGFLRGARKLHFGKTFYPPWLWGNIIPHFSKFVEPYPRRFRSSSDRCLDHPKGNQEKYHEHQEALHGRDGAYDDDRRSVRRHQHRHLGAR